MCDSETPPAEAVQQSTRRGFISKLSSLAMVGALVTAYGSLAGFFGRFFYPARPPGRNWLFVSEVAQLAVGDSIPYQLPGGSPVHITRHGDSGGAQDFLALSSTCPHLGCQVHWEARHQRFFCPCHNGTFNPEGKATGGPPADAGQSLLQYPLKVENRLLFVEAPQGELALGHGAPSSSHPCSQPDRNERRA